MTTSKRSLRNKMNHWGESRIRVKRRLLVESLCDRRVLATVTGMVFDDVNDSWRRDSQEASLEGRLVFADTNNNGVPDDGERFALTEIDGSFSLEELGSDDSIVRLFSSAASQRQLFPVHPDAGVDPIELGDFVPAGASGNLVLDPSGGRGVLQAAQGVIIVDLTARTATAVSLDATPVTSAFLADGRILVLASNELGNHAFLVGSAGEVEPADLFALPSEGSPESGGDDPVEFESWAGMSIDADGQGLVVLRGHSGSLPARKLTVQGDGLSTLATSTAISPSASLIGGGQVTTVIAEPVDGGVALSLWSNSTGTLILEQAVVVPGADRVLAYSDSSGLVYASSSGQGDLSGSVWVLDAANAFAVVQTITDLDDLVVVDAARSVVFSLSPHNARLRAIDALTAQTLADWMIDLDLAGPPTEIALHAAGKELVLLGAAGLATLSLDRIDAHRVKLASPIPQYPLRFAVDVQGENTPPQFTAPLEFDVAQGVPLVLSAGGLFASAVDADGDRFVLVRNSSPQHGVATITPVGGLTYTPDADFVGTDSFEVFLHDGRGHSTLTTVHLHVAPVVVAQPQIQVTVLPVPENAHAEFVVGQIEASGFGEGPLSFVITDPRFQVIGNLIVVVQGAVLDYEDEYRITTSVTATNQSTGQTASQAFTVELSDEDDPIEDIQPRSASIHENVQGELIAELMVIDQDAEQPFILSVDDERFEIINRNLRLKPGMSLDYEAGSEVVINITATSALGGSNSLTVPFTITVVNAAEQAVSITLSNNTVVEWVAGAPVGNVIVDGNPLGDSYLASVDDSRFEIIDGVLKLRSGEFLSRSDQQEAQVIITIQDSGRVFAAVAEKFVIVVLENENPFNNPDNPYDVNGDGLVTPLDALMILNAISQNGGAGPISQFPTPGRYWDVNGDGLITPLDALLVLNFINRQNQLLASGEPESLQKEIVPAPPAAEPIAQRDPLQADLQSLPLAAAPSIEDTRRGITALRGVSLAEIGQRVQSALDSPFASRLIDRALQVIDQRPEVRAAVDGFRSDLQRLQHSLRERLTPEDRETLERLKSAVTGQITPEVAARIELALARLRRV